MAEPDAIAIEDFLSGADIIPLTMALVTVTGNFELLDEVAPHVRGPWDHSESVPEPLKARIREQAAACWRNGAFMQEPPPLSSENVAKMMSAAVGSEVAPEYVPMLVEHMGLTLASSTRSTEPIPTTRSQAGADFSVVVVGAGASGLCAGIKLDEAGFDYTIIEKNDEVGGTWFENHYPGCAVDTPNHFYQFSFEPNNDWPNYYSRQPSILAYLKHCAEKYDVRRHIRFEEELVSAQYDADACVWRIVTRHADGRITRLAANALVCAVGQLNRPAVPDIPGLENFEGDILHTAAWRDEVELGGKRVALVGTGASAVQVGPALVDSVASLHVMQRSGAWVARSPNVHRAVTHEKKWVLTHIPFYAQWYRFLLFWAFGDDRFKALEIDAAWTENGAISGLNAQYRQMMERHIRRELEGREDLISRVIPDYPPFGKRVLADAGWFKMLRREHVTLVTSGIRRVERHAIVTDEGGVDVDAIIFATGFQAGKMLWPMDIKGRDGRTIREIWGDDNPRAFLGISVPNFPNMFVMYGPNTNLGHGGSAIFLAECQMRYIVDLLKKMREHEVAEVEIKQDVHDTYNEKIDKKLQNLVWSHPSVKGWYKNRQGRIITNQPWRLIDYWQLTHDADLDDYFWDHDVSQSA